jgi:CMP-N-acetylneuraminic acid synthetase
VSPIAIIPARGGSKRIPRKNLALCGGKPLVAYTFAAAKASRHLGRVLLSTDDDAIAALGRAHGIEVPYMRPAALATDDTPMLDILQDLVTWLDRAGSGKIEAIVLLQPTSPLRTAAHIDEAIELFRAHPEADSVVSVVEPPHIFHPLKMLKPSGRGLVPFVDGVEPVAGHRDLPPAFARNGPAVLVVRPEIIRRGEVYGQVSHPYVMEARDSVDIDEPLDLEIADLLLRRRG